MEKIKFIINLFTMLAIAYGILHAKSLLSSHLIDNETPYKHALNRFLNGEVD